MSNRQADTTVDKKTATQEAESKQPEELGEDVLSQVQGGSRLALGDLPVVSKSDVKNPSLG